MGPRHVAVDNRPKWQIKKVFGFRDLTFLVSGCGDVKAFIAAFKSPVLPRPVGRTSRHHFPVLKKAGYLKVRVPTSFAEQRRTICFLLLKSPVLQGRLGGPAGTTFQPLQGLHRVQRNRVDGQAWSLCFEITVTLVEEMIQSSYSVISLPRNPNTETRTPNACDTCRL